MPVRCELLDSYENIDEIILRVVTSYKKMQYLLIKSHNYTKNEAFRPLQGEGSEKLNDKKINKAIKIIKRKT